MSDATVATVHRIVNACPLLESTLKEHVCDFGEVLPHLFLGDVSRVAVALADEERRGDRQADASTGLGALLAALDREFVAGREEIRELISVSFLENFLDETAAPHVAVRMGPALRRELARMRAWRPTSPGTGPDG